MDNLKVLEELRVSERAAVDIKAEHDAEVSKLRVECATAEAEVKASRKSSVHHTQVLQEQLESSAAECRRLTGALEAAEASKKTTEALANDATQQVGSLKSQMEEMRVALTTEAEKWIDKAKVIYIHMQLRTLLMIFFFPSYLKSSLVLCFRLSCMHQSELSCMPAFPKKKLLHVCAITLSLFLHFWARCYCSSLS
jgi:hypothetical protein